MFENEIADIAHDVWETMFGVQLEPATAAELTGPSLTGMVHIDGAWRGAVTLRCPTTLAADLTQRVFGESTDAEVRDLVGELTNQLGGNIKALLPEGCTLSLPAVAFGSDYELSVVDATVVATVALTCEGAPLLLSLLEQAP